MKAKLKSTKEIINIIRSSIILDSCDTWGNPIEVSLDDVAEFLDNNGLPLGFEKQMKAPRPIILEPTPTVDWEQRRYELAKEYSKEFVRLQHYKGMSETGVVSSKVSEWSIELADALIKELKNRNNYGK